MNFKILLKTKKMGDTAHAKFILAYIAATRINNANDVMDIGGYLVSQGAEKLIDGGFWIWDIVKNKEFYSPKFRQSLQYLSEADFPSLPTSWQNAIFPEDKIIAMQNADFHLESGGKKPYDQKVQYYKKDGSVLTVICSGTMLKNEKGDVVYMVGTHKIVD